MSLSCFYLSAVGEQELSALGITELGSMSVSTEQRRDHSAGRSVNHAANLSTPAVEHCCFGGKGCKLFHPVGGRWPVLSVSSCIFEPSVAYDLDIAE